MLKICKNRHITGHKVCPLCGKAAWPYRRLEIPETPEPELRAAAVPAPVAVPQPADPPPQRPLRLPLALAGLPALMAHVPFYSYARAFYARERFARKP